MPSCKLFAGLGSTNKSATSLLSDSRSVLHLSFYLNFSGRSGRNCFLSYSIRLQWVPGHSFFLGNDAIDELARRGGLLVPSAIPCSLSSLLLSLISNLLFSRTGGILSHLNFLRHRFSRFPLRNLCSYNTFPVSSLVYAATDRAYC